MWTSDLKKANVSIGEARYFSHYHLHSLSFHTLKFLAHFFTHFYSPLFLSSHIASPVLHISKNTLSHSSFPHTRITVARCRRNRAPAQVQYEVSTKGSPHSPFSRLLDFSFRFHMCFSLNMLTFLSSGLLSSLSSYLVQSVNEAAFLLRHPPAR